MKKKLTAMLLIMSMVCTFLPVSAMAAEATPEAAIGDVQYNTLQEAIDAAKDGETVTLLKDTSLDANLKVNESMTINCGNAIVETNGHKFLVASGADVILTAANGGVKNTVAATSKDDLKSMLCVSEGGILTIQDGNYSTKAAQLILSNGKVIIENGKFVCDAEDIASNAAINEKVAFNISGEKASLIFKNGSLQADVGTETHYMLYGIYAQGGASLVLGNEDGTGPTVKSIEPPIGLNNTTSAPAINITVNGGTYQSRVDAPEKYEQFNGVFYLSGACNVVINNGNFVAAHPSNQYNHIISIPYKNVAANVTIKNGSFSSSSSIVFEGTNNASVETGAPSVNISGGTYNSDVTKYCVEGLMAQLQDGQYVIVEVPLVNVEVEQETLLAEPEVSIDPAITQDKQDDAKAVAESVAPTKGDSIAPQVDENVQKAETSDAVMKLEANGLINVDDQGNITAPAGGDVTVTVVREAYFDVKAVALEGDTFTLDITPKYNLLATTDENLTDGLDETKTVTIAKGKDSQVSGDVEISVQLPANFANDGDTIFVQHKGYEYEATVSEKNGEVIATFINPHGFSTFTFSKDSKAVATIGSQSYISLQAAVDAVKDGETIKLTQANSEDVTVNREVSFTLDTTSGTFTGTVKAGNGFELVQNGNTYTVTKASNGGGTVVKRYDVTLADTDNGSITATHKRASKNSTVTITATPADGYVVDAVTVTEKDGDKVEVTKKDDNKYTFKMPASDVTVKATFKVAPTEPEQPSGLPFTDVAKDAWYFPAVEYVFNNGLMNGTTATTFAPNVELNRAMMAAVLYNMEGGPACDKSGLFSDVADGKWYTDAVNWAASNNIVSGMPDGTYAPNQALTREQMASVLYRYAEYKGIDVSARADLSTFTDGTTVSPWAQDVVQWAVAEKLMSGNGNELQPKGTASRAQVATVLMNYCENVAK